MRLLREPLLHFVAFGVAVFALQAALGEEADEASVERADIVVDDGVRADLDRQLARTLGRPPTADELAAAIDRWVTTEVMVREARRLGLDRDDPVVRDRLARKMAFVNQASAVPPEPTDAELRALYDAVSDEYRLDTSLTLRQLYVAGRDGRDAAEVLRARWEAGEDPRALTADEPPGGPVLRGRTPERLAERYGEDFPAAVEALAPGEKAVVEGLEGWHVLEVEAKREGRVLTFEEARERLVVRWKADHIAAASAAAAAALLERYEVVR